MSGGRSNRAVRPGARQSSVAPTAIVGEGKGSAAYQRSIRDRGVRIAVFVTPASWNTWWTPKKFEKGQFRDVLDLLDGESRAVAPTLRTRPVSRAVNNVRTLDRRDAGLIEAVTRGGGDC